MKFVLALDLIDDQALIEEYEYWHRPENADPRVTEQIIRSGIMSMEIYRIADRLVMIMEAGDTFSFERKQLMDIEDPHVQAWEKLMWRFQKALPFANPNEKWLNMSKVYDLKQASANTGTLQMQC